MRVVKLYSKSQQQMRLIRPRVDRTTMLSTFTLAAAAAHRLPQSLAVQSRLGLAFGSAQHATKAVRTSAPMMGVASVGDYVNVRYSLLHTETGAPVSDSVFDIGEVGLVVGKGGFFPGLHARVPEVDEVGKQVSFDLSPAECFGDANPGLGPAKVPLSSAPPGLKAGEVVQLANGMKARVTDVDDEGVTIDANHALAGVPFKMALELTSEPKSAATALEEATFAGGCFWGLELAYQREPGVVSTAVGYTQGHVEEPSYEQVCSGNTGHTEAVRVLFDPSLVDYERLCELFWERLGDNRYLLNQVGNDRGTQYRHGIYTHSAAQLKAAMASLEKQQASAPSKPIKTEVLEAKTFWDAEDYHQQYLQKGGQDAKKEAKETIRCYG